MGGPWDLHPGSRIIPELGAEEPDLRPETLSVGHVHRSC